MYDHYLHIIGTLTDVLLSSMFVTLSIVSGDNLLFGMNILYIGIRIYYSIKNKKKK